MEAPRADTRPPLPDWHEADPAAFVPDRESVRRWLEAYVRAWQSYDPAAIADLWTEDAVWIYPFGVRARGRAAIVADWLAEQHLDEGVGYDGHCAESDGDTAAKIATKPAARINAFISASRPVLGSHGHPG